MAAALKASYTFCALEDTPRDDVVETEDDQLAINKLVHVVELIWRLIGIKEGLKFLSFKRRKRSKKLNLKGNKLEQTSRSNSSDQAAAVIITANPYR